MRYKQDIIWTLFCLMSSEFHKFLWEIYLFSCISLLPLALAATPELFAGIANGGRRRRSPWRALRFPDILIL